MVKVSEKFTKIRKNLPRTVSQDQLAELFRPISNGRPPDESTVTDLTRMSLDLNTDVLVLSEVVRTDDQWTGSAQLFDARTQEFSPAEVIRTSEGVRVLEKKAKILVRNLLQGIDENGYVIPDPELTPKITDPKQENANKPAPVNLMPGSSLNAGPTAGIDPAFQSLSPSTARNGIQDKKWYQKWWVWALIGGVAAGTAAGALALNQSNTKILIDNRGNVPQ